jgi:subfamily B ATP-binding cassette protein MsbA
MKNFYRSIRYLWPYRIRLAVSLVCVVLISVLWAGGLGMIGPGSKILITEEGLHGWAYDKIIGDSLGLNGVQRIAPLGARPIDGRNVVDFIDVIRVDPGGQAAGAGIGPGVWLIGLDDGQADHRLMRSMDLARSLAGLTEGRGASLRTYSPITGQVVVARLEPGPVGWSSGLLGRLVALIPEPTGHAGRYNMFLGVLGVVLAMTILRDALRFVQEYLVGSAANRAVMDIRCETYRTVLCLPTTYFAQYGTTDMMSRFVTDTAELRRGQITLLGKTLAEPAKAIGSVAMAMVFSWRLTLLAMLVGPPAYWLIRRFGKRMKRAAKKMLESWSSMIAVLDETLTGIRVVKAYTMEGSERKRFFQVNRRLLKQLNRMVRIDAATAPTIEVLGVIGACCAGALAGRWVLFPEHDMRMEDFMGLMACMAAMFDPLRKLAKVVTRFQRAEAAAARVFELHDLEQEKSPPNAVSLPRHAESIRFEQVSFRYPAAAEDSVREVDLTIRAGQTIAIVGPNGSGKTTLLSLLPRLLVPTAGRILIDGCDIATASLRSLRRQIGLVTQETVLFHATIGENISYGLRRARGEDVLAAARKAFVDEFVRDLPDGYDTMVGEHGATLSGGQRQRIAIARAILRDPAILIFDEAMSQIDADSEQRIHLAMEQFVQDRTALMIAHRFQTVLSADQIAVMDAGRILDVGTHEDLLARCRLYRHLYETQLAGRSE